MPTPHSKVVVQVFLKREVLDPEARAIQTTVDPTLIANLMSLRICKQYEFDFDLNAETAVVQAKSIAEKYLANPVSQSFEIKVIS